VKIGLVLLSGGLDSTTVAALALHEGYELSALTVDYGQTHRQEVAAAQAVAASLGVAHHIASVEFFRQLAWYSALTSPDRYSAPVDRDSAAMAADIPITYVPLRNTFLLTLGAAALESRALALIEAGGADARELSPTLFIAANAIDYSGYPDCRPEFYRAAGETLRLGSKLGTQYGVRIEIRTPLIDKGKREIVELGLALGAPLDRTWSCYGPGPAPCGRCDSCELRAKGFAEAGAADPALLRIGTAPRAAHARGGRATPR